MGLPERPAPNHKQTGSRIPHPQPHHEVILGWRLWATLPKREIAQFHWGNGHPLLLYCLPHYFNCLKFHDLYAFSTHREFKETHPICKAWNTFYDKNQVQRKYILELQVSSKELAQHAPPRILKSSELRANLAMCSLSNQSSKRNKTNCMMLISARRSISVPQTEEENHFLEFRAARTSSLRASCRKPCTVTAAENIHSHTPSLRCMRLLLVRCL